MSMEYSGSGDPTRTMALLWGTQKKPSRGPKPSLSVEQIVRTAIELADTDGVAALSMRRLADGLGVSAMSLYTYVPSKAELIDVMLDAVLGEAVGTNEGACGWREKLEVVARENWALYHRHPWMLHVAAISRPPLGPHMIAKYDYELRAVEGIGLTDIEMDSVLTLVLGYVQGAARTSVESSQAERSTGISDYEWWSANAPLLEKVFDSAHYPIAARVGLVAGETYEAAHDPGYAFEFGLRCVLDGIHSLVRSRT